MARFLTLACLFAIAAASDMVAAPTGAYEGSVPFIIDIKLTFSSATAVDMDINVKIAHQEIKCQGEAIAIDGNSITFPNTGKTGDCMGDALRGQKKDVTKYIVDINSDGSLAFHSDGYPIMKLKKKAELAPIVVAPPTGAYEGSVPFIIDIQLTFNSATAVDMDINVKIAHQEIKCQGEAIAIDGSTISFPNTGKTGDCMGDALRGQKKDPTKYTVDIKDDGSLAFHSDGYPIMKLKKKAELAPIVVAPPTGAYEGSVPFIIDIQLTFNSATAVDMDINVKIAHQEIKCQGEAIAIDGSSITFPNTGKTGDCMGDALRGQKKDVTKYIVDINSDGSLAFHSDGYPIMKLKKKAELAPIVV